MTIDGYEVEKTAHGYILHGKRGAWYALIRHAEKPEMLFPMKLTGGAFNLPRVLQNAWFTDRTGELTHA